MITSDSSILIPFERLPLGFADPWRNSTLVCQGASFLANETLVTQLHLEFYNFLKSLFFVFLSHVCIFEFVEKGRTFQDVGDSGFTLFAGALWATLFHMFSRPR